MESFSLYLKPSELGLESPSPTPSAATSLSERQVGTYSLTQHWQLSKGLHGMGKGNPMDFSLCSQPTKSGWETPSSTSSSTASCPETCTLGREGGDIMHLWAWHQHHHPRCQSGDCVPPSSFPTSKSGMQLEKG